ncbi:LOW QUALITY PROTEIN: olfactory receptor 1D2-like [Choloepus didactylus]|uniref:LOW QUALITY PROTEIN: olfactory receptor 1D2-like n=1 Tax=Choloepus didactylus TaxID=27675 RepID=UPI00189EBE32|nr:LOW QUALITY PROTEIN: olfactory receptor 1D2-like [Choloepus didactylus]
MDGGNQTHEQQKVLFWLFLSIYLVTVVGNVLIILAIGSDSCLHTPMYFFLANLSFTDLFFITNTMSRMLVNLQAQNKAISYAGCLMQLYFLVFLVALDNLILAAMTYDHFVTICHPLLYSMAMSPGLYVLLLALGDWVFSVLYSIIHTFLMNRVTFCGSSKIHSIFWEMYILMRLTCSNTQTNHLVLTPMGCFIFLTPIGFMVISYVLIVRASPYIHSATGKYKAFSTCVSHMAVVSLFFGILGMVYLQPLHTYSMRDSVATVMYAVVTPMMNPFIYSLRNKDMHGALGRLLLGKVFKG